MTLFDEVAEEVAQKREIDTEVSDHDPISVEESRMLAVSALIGRDKVL